MDFEMELEVFRAGDFGPRGAYSEDDLEVMARDYDPQSHEAPVTVDHCQEGPALGWVRALRRSGGALLARLGGLDAGFLEQLKSGAFKKRSVELYRGFEGTDRPYLKALTFLGAGAPVVKGMADPAFSENDPSVWIQWAEADAMASVEAHEDEETVGFADEPKEEAEALVPEDVERFCERLRDRGRLLPAWEEKGLGRFVAALDDEAPRLFSDDPEAAGMTARAWFQEFLESLGALVPMGEMAPAPHRGFAESALGSESTPSNWRGARIDEESLKLHRRVCEFRRANPEASYCEALGAVAAGN